MICPCGNEFKVANWQLKQGRGKYCSKACKYKYRVRPSGLKYNIVNENTTWVKPGQRLSPETEFKPGKQNNPNGGIKPGQRISLETEFKKGQTPSNFKGDDVGYFALHAWISRHKGPAKDFQCSCGNPAQEWANISHQYKRDLNDFMALCKKCHKAHDKGKSSMKERFQ